MLVSLVVGALVLVPALVFLYALFQRREPQQAGVPGTAGEPGRT